MDMEKGNMGRTYQAIYVLNEDIKIATQSMIDANEKSNLDESEYHARVLIRAIFAYIEAKVVFLKLSAYRTCIESKISLSEGEKLYVLEKEFFLKNNGELKERKARIRFEDNIRFAFKLLEKISKLNTNCTKQGKYFDSNASWWSQLKKSISVRDRLMHPKSLQDIRVSEQETNDAIQGLEGFMEVSDLYLKSCINVFSN